MPYTISGTYSTLVTLGSLSDNPTTITAAGLLNDGLSVSYPGLSVVNAGTIIGGNDGIFLLAGGSVTNQSGGSISSGGFGVYGNGNPVTVVNAGSIAGYFGGVRLSAGGNVTNQSGGSITSGFIGINAYGGVTVVNAGTIGGARYAVLFGAGYANRLVIDPNAVFSGKVTGGNTIGATSVSTLELASAGSAGTLSGLGTQYVDFAQVTVDAGAQWTLAGANTLAPGYHLTDAGTLTNAGTLNGAGVLTGVLTLVPGGVLSNVSTGTITAGAGSAVHGLAGGAATVVNAGVIAGDGAEGQGVYLAGGGSVTNLSGEVISGDRYGIYGRGATVTVVNAGTIAGSGPNAYGAGIDLAAGGSVTNLSGGSISGYRGISGQGSAVTMVNAGTIAGSNEGVVLSAGGNVTNQSGGSIAGGFVGISGAGAAATVVNAGSIAGSRQGVVLFAGGNVTNQSGGSITGQDGIFGAGAAATVVNAGSIAGSNIGVLLEVDGSVTNQSGGAISGIYGIYGYKSAVTVVNAGSITGSNDAVLFAPGFANRLVIDPDAVFSGTVTGGNTIGAAYVSTLELASAGSAGTLSGLGTQFVDFAQVTLDAGAQWTLTGSNMLASGDTITNAGTLTLSDAMLSGAADLVNNGAIVLDPSNMTIASLTGAGSFTIKAGSTLDVTGVIASTETIVFAGPGASLLLGTPDSAAGSVTGFAAGDTIDLAGIAPASVSDAGGTISFTGGSFPLTSTIPLVIESDGNGGTDIVPCFAEGTRIATPDGSVTVEALRGGDRVLTASGAVLPVRWIGFRTIDLTRHPAPDQVQPIRIAAGAFAAGVPSRDLRLSPDHAVLLHGLLIPIKLLRNDASITREIDCRSVTYYHVELDAHDVLVAEGLAAESYLDTGNRAMFGNAGLPVILHPDLTNDQARREIESCAPFADQPAVIEPIWRTLAARAEQMGLASPPMPETTDDPALHLIVDGLRCTPTSAVHGRYIFLIAGNTAEVRLVSRHALRPDTAPWVADSRRLGVQLGAMTIRCGGAVVPVPLDHPLLADGWWEPEWHAATVLRRWTKGDAVVPLMEAGPGPLVLEVEVASTVPYPLPSAARKAGTRRVISMAG